MKFLRTDTDFGTESELGAIGKGGRHICIDTRRIDTLLEKADSGRILADDRLAVLRRITGNVRDRLVE